MITPQQHAQLYRELANYLTVPDIERGTIPARSSCLAIRARQAAEEIEGRKVPSDEEILACRSWSCHGPTFDSDLVQFGRDVLARFGGGEAGNG